MANNMLGAFKTPSERKERSDKAIKNLRIPTFDDIYNQILSEIPELEEVEAAELAVKVLEEFKAIENKPYSGIFETKPEKPYLRIVGWRDDTEMYDKMWHPSNKRPRKATSITIAGAEFNIIIRLDSKEISVNYIKAEIKH